MTRLASPEIVGYINKREEEEEEEENLWGPARTPSLRVALWTTTTTQSKASALVCRFPMTERRR